MRLRLALITGLVGAWAMSPAPAVAFQETQVPAPVVVPQTATPSGEAFTFDNSASAGSAATAKAGKSRGGLRLLPKLDFGLELLYGPSEPSTTMQAMPTQPPSPSEDMTILGTVKRRF